jgi:hypothetical protein
MQDAFGIQHLLETIAVFKEKGALVGAVVAGQMLALTTGTRMQPFGVFDKKVRPTRNFARISVGHGRSDRCPVLFRMALDEFFGPTGSWIGMVLRESDYGSGSCPHSCSARSCR